MLVSKMIDMRVNKNIRRVYSLCHKNMVKKYCYNATFI